MPTAGVNGINMYYQVQGRGVPLIMIQGFAGNHQAWFLQTHTFKRHYKVVIFDNRGIGRTEKSSAPYTIRTMADDVIALMNYLNIDKAHVLGLSLGGIVAQEIAISYPERVIKLVLCSTFADRELKDVHPELAEALGAREDSAHLDIGNMDFKKLMNFFVPAAFNKKLYKMAVVLLSRFGLRLLNPDGYLSQMEAVGGYSTVDRLQQIKAPTLVITGTEDRVIAADASEVIASRIPNARLVMVKGGSHAFFMEMRGRFNREVLDFLRGG